MALRDSSPFPPAFASLDLPLVPTDSATTTFLANFDGINGQNTYTAETGQVLTFRGTPILSSSSKKYGSTSLYTPGTSSNCVHFANSNGWDFGTGDFTIDVWVNPQGGTWGNIFCYSGAQFMFSVAGGPQVWAGGGWWQTGSGFVPQIGTWYHVAWVRNGTSSKTYVNGSAVISTAETPRVIAAPTSPRGTAIGAEVSDPAPYSQFTNQFIQALRVSKGVARWTSDFIPPTNFYTLV